MDFSRTVAALNTDQFADVLESDLSRNGDLLPVDEACTNGGRLKSVNGIRVSASDVQTVNGFVEIPVTVYFTELAPGSCPADGRRYSQACMLKLFIDSENGFARAEFVSDIYGARIDDL